MGGFLEGVAGVLSPQWEERFQQDVATKNARKQAWLDQQRTDTIAQHMATAKQIRDQLAHVDNLHKALAYYTDPNTHQVMPGHEHEAARLQEQLKQFNLDELHGNLNNVEGYIQKLYDPNFNFQTGMPEQSPIRALGEKLHLVKPQVEQQKTAGEIIKDLQGIRQKYDVAAPGIAAGEQELETEAATRESEQKLERGIETTKRLAEKYLPPDVAKQTTEESITAQLGGAKPTAAKVDKVKQDLKGPDGTLYQEHESGAVTTMGGDAVPKEMLAQLRLTPVSKAGAGRESQYDEQLDVYLRGIHKTRETMTPEDQANFLKSRVPYGDAKFLMAQQRLRLDETRVDLMRSYQNFEAFNAIQKNLAPLEKIQTAAANADYYVQNPSGTGDSALVFAFLDAVKTSGFRFNQQEQNFILTARPLAENLNMKYVQGVLTGESLDPGQRQRMADIIKNAATQVGTVQQRYVSGAAAFKPEAAAAAGDIIRTKGKRSLKAAMALPAMKGKSEDEVRQALKQHGYEVVEDTK